MEGSSSVILVDDSILRDVTKFSSSPILLSDLLGETGAMLILKGGEFGGLAYSVRERILKRLEAHYEVIIGSRYAPSKEEALKRWGKTGIRKLLGNLQSIILKEEFDRGVNYVDTNNGEAFNKWLGDIKKEYEDPRVRGLGFLWSYLQEDSQYLYLKKKEDITRKKILDDYGISEREANKLLGDDYDKVSEQFFVNKLLVGPAETDEAPYGTLRNIIYQELTGGELKKTVREGKAWQAPLRTIMASANGIHSAGTQDETSIDIENMPPEDKDSLFQISAGITKETSPPVVIGEKLPQLNLNQYYDPTLSPRLYRPAEIINEVDTKNKQFLNNIQGASQEAELRRHLLSARRDFFVKIIKEAYEARGEYTFYHGLIAIARLLPYIVQQIIAKDDKDTVNIYLARDAANYWFTRKMMESNSFEEKT